jgi:hypothetical protein
LERHGEDVEQMISVMEVMKVQIRWWDGTPTDWDPQQQGKTKVSQANNIDGGDKGAQQVGNVGDDGDDDIDVQQVAAASSSAAADAVPAPALTRTSSLASSVSTATRCWTEEELDRWQNVKFMHDPAYKPDWLEATTLIYWAPEKSKLLTADNHLRADVFRRIKIDVLQGRKG